jgi:hypothetical protein
MHALGIGNARGTLSSVLGRPASCQLRMGNVELSSAAPRYAMLWSSRKMRQSRSVMSSRAFSDQCDPTCSMSRLQFGHFELCRQQAVRVLRPCNATPSTA